MRSNGMHKLKHRENVAIKELRTRDELAHTIMTLSESINGQRTAGPHNRACKCEKAGVAASPSARVDVVVVKW